MFANARNFLIDKSYKFQKFKRLKAVIRNATERKSIKNFDLR